MYQRVNPTVGLRSRVEREEESLTAENVQTEDHRGGLRTSNAKSLAKSFHKTISKDWTDQEALEGQRLVALQEKSGSNIPYLNAPLPSSERALNSLQIPPLNEPPVAPEINVASIAKSKQNFL